ncbi:U4/U6 small nuclear ribonucleoprotein Prp31 isoform X2 [Neomonachus schauinslandi]|uniref:U4/U6 small nuclear ribonucleoprotein Prp31 n=1 Tax=Neomonachus schauinslandi TaxID=29088 RepID=A0A8M1MX65_NEOSC|nr:PREDICTED: U4/U6 small nuclear ribonucleoprotein Prp31 isoform X2 [Odobenus rosmarus divergens]XP_044777935.1 U4/U6 small nuclear ribonucleoprotein Prp31 isoform X2 [Neomonachus schauinslandi]
MSLADELLADLEEAAEEEEGGSYGEEEEEPAIEDVQEETQLDLSGDSVKSIAKLWDSKMFAEIMMKIEEYISKQAKASEVMGPVEAAPEYRVIVDANNLTVEIENELNIIHKFIRDKYSKRFPELESLVPNALDYIRTVKELGNSLDKCKNNENLQQILTNATIMVVSVTASTTQGQQLSEEGLERLEEACDMALELNASKHRIYEYVESRMSFIAPNLSIIIGASTAAKIMGVAGGLTNLSKMPACNIMLLGAQRKTLSGFSSTSVLPHTGYIYHSDIVQSLPPDLRRKAARLEPPPVKQVKPLPAPLDGQRKKRGGRRYRKMKERLGLTEIRKQANRMSFGEIEEDAYQEDLGFSLGHLGKSGSGRVRQTQVNEATKARISKTLQRTLQKQSVVYGGKSTIRDRSSGTASSVAFTPLQGLEIVNPQAAEKKVAEANQKYFSSMAEFLKVKGEKSGIMST